MILSIDCGTQSIRAILFSFKGDIIDKEQIFYEPYFSEKVGWAEQKAEVYWDGLCKATNILKKRNPLDFDKINGVGVTTLRNTMVNVDNEINTLRPSMTWLDQRNAENTYKPNFALNWVLKIMGVKPTIQKMERLGHSNWIQQNQAEIWQKTHKYMQVSGYLNAKLTGEFADSIASQVGYIPFDYKKQNWANPNDLLEMTGKLFPIKKEKLAKLLKPGERIGIITQKAFELTGIAINTPVIACGSDKSCETLGMGVMDTKMASLSFGTIATVQTTSPKYIEPKRFFPAYTSCMPGYWNPEMEIFRGFWMISWFKNEFAHKEVQEAAEKNIPAEEVLNDLLHKSPPGSMGLIVQPYWSPGLKEKHAKGAMIGFGDVHKKEHVYRAVIEGLAYGMLDGMQRLEKRGNLNFEKLAVSGGASQSDEICQIVADVFNMPLVRGKTHETSGLGAAILTAYGVDKFTSINQAVENMVSYTDTFNPKPENVKIYKALYKDVYLKMYKNLEPLYKRIRKITNYPKD